jgi:DNA-binding transcriptional MerR regulator
MWTVGQLASATGVTVRALHHYDAQGLLVPSARTEAGYRLYSDADVERLYRIRALQALGLSLTEVAEALDGLPLADILGRQLEALDAELEHARSLRVRLLRLHHAATVEELVETMKEVEMHERYFTTDQREAIASRSHLAADGERAWRELISDVRAEQEAGTDPQAPRMQELAARWRELIGQFTGGDPAIRDSLARMYEQEGPPAASRGGVDPELMRYVGEALRSL